ncbi:TetR family transcriptional regulator [Paenibacillus sp. HJGM_3]|uniref:TetR family transcriptional regulator n=1 Tax=Paenibacillus sp. HJGM_3 TaxID=3379816 RepID=UPI0038583FCB
MPPADSDMKLRIILAAKQLFASQGYDCTTVRQICEEAGANVALVSYYFGGKENLFYELFNQFFTGSKDIMEHAHLFEEPVEGLKRLIEELIRFRVKEPQLVQLMQQEILKNTQRIDYIRSQVFPVWKLLRRLLEQGKTAGLFQYRSLDNMMFFIMGTILFHKQSDYFQPLVEDTPPTFDELVQDTQQFILGGLGFVDPV